MATECLAIAQRRQRANARALPHRWDKRDDTAKAAAEKAAENATADKAAEKKAAATEGMDCSFWFVNADSLRRAWKPSLLGGDGKGRSRCQSSEAGGCSGYQGKGGG